MQGGARIQMLQAIFFLQIAADFDESFFFFSIEKLESILERNFEGVFFF